MGQPPELGLVDDSPSQQYGCLLSDHVGFVIGPKQTTRYWYPDVGWINLLNVMFVNRFQSQENGEMIP